MLPANIVNALQTLVNTARQPLAPDKLTTPVTPAPKLEPGQQLQASVQSKLPDGMFKVQVAGQTLQMRLPVNIQSGDTIRLQVVSVQPKITFSIAASTNPLSTPEQIGSAARMLSDLSNRPIERPLVQQMGDKAVWAATQQAPDVKQLAAGLREAVGKSGLFYESHQAQWVRGERSTGQLLEEPQNLLTGKALHPEASQSLLAGRSLPPGMASAAQLAADKQPLVQQAQLAASAAIKQDDGGPPIAREVLPLVQQQLHTLENHHMVWLGQVWPGQQMQWEIQGEPEHAGQQQDEREWSTEMELSLPRLGDVRAKLVFAERGLRLTLHAADETTAGVFSQALPQLRDALDDAGIALVSAAVEKS